mmetsp:Transcript_72162/g.181893  ORF Transcript_72162/g.181893 Transcript_72162/m.181893 type:complete len:129 (-) Transcript_72162:162-548(-)
MQLRSLLLVALASTASCTLVHKSTLDINQKVYIEGSPVLGDGAGETALNVCQAFARSHVDNEHAPAVKVCGTGIKTTFFMRARCENYYEHSKVLGSCNTGLPADTCESFSPAQDKTFGHYQSYLIEQC